MICKYRDFYIFLTCSNYMIENKCFCINHPSNLINIQQSIVALKEWSNVLITFLNWVHELLKRCTRTESFWIKHTTVYLRIQFVFGLWMVKFVAFHFDHLQNKNKMMIYCNTCFLLWYLVIIFLLISNKIYTTTNKCH